MLNKKTIIISALIILLILLLPLLFYYFIPKKVEFNQFLLQKLESKYNTATFEITKDKIFSKYSMGINFLRGNLEKEPNNLENPEEIFSYIFSNVPPYAIVYPTEAFYYFSTSINDIPIAGNIRIADLDKGRISFAYFTINPDIEKETWITEFTEEDGLKVNKKSDYLYYLTYKEKTVRFKIPKTDFEAPEKITLTPEEKFMGQIHDESGIRLFLIYNQNTTSFYEVLNDEKGTTDKLIEIDDKHLIGSRTGFIYYLDEDYERRILVGTPLAEAEENNYLDGPGDQVPFRINFKEEINIAYPNTLLEAGTDEHGVYLNKTEWVRIAVSPYHKYNNMNEIIEKTSKCTNKENKSVFWTCLTKEWWNTPELRKGIYRQLKEEGKNVTEYVYQMPQINKSE